MNETPRLKALKSAPLDSWVVLSPDERTVLVAAATFEEVARKADEAQLPEDAVTVKTPKSWASFSV